MSLGIKWTGDALSGRIAGAATHGGFMCGTRAGGARSLGGCRGAGILGAGRWWGGQSGGWT